MFAGARLYFAVCGAALALAAGLSAETSVPGASTADVSFRQFLSQKDGVHAYRASRRLQAQNGDRTGWLEADTEYSAEHGFRYAVTGQGGSGFIVDHILKSVLDGEREILAKGDVGRSEISLVNYRFGATGIAEDGLATVQVSPRRKDHLLVDGTLFIRPRSGDPVRLEGRLVKSPSFWVKDVDIVWSYARFHRAVMPVALTSNAEIRFVGSASLRVSYRYFEIDGRPVEGVPRSVP